MGTFTRGRWRFTHSTQPLGREMRCMASASSLGSPPMCSGAPPKLPRSLLGNLGDLIWGQKGHIFGCGTVDAEGKLDHPTGFRPNSITL